MGLLTVIWLWSTVETQPDITSNAIMVSSFSGSRFSNFILPGLGVVNGELEHFIACANGTRVNFVCALRFNHVDEFLNDIHI